MATYQGLQIRYLLPSVGLAGLISAPPILGLMGTTLVARLTFVTVLVALTLFFYHLRSWRKELGIALVAISLEFAFLVIIFFKPEYPLRQVVFDAIGADLAGLAWQVTMALSGVMVIVGSAVLLWGIHAHSEKKEEKSK